MKYKPENLEESAVPYYFLQKSYSFLESILEHLCPMPACVRELIENGPYDQNMMTEEQRKVLINYRNHLGRIYRVAREADYSCIDLFERGNLKFNLPFFEQYLDSLNQIFGPITIKPKRQQRQNKPMPEGYYYKKGTYSINNIIGNIEKKKEDDSSEEFYF